MPWVGRVTGNDNIILSRLIADQQVSACSTEFWRLLIKKITGLVHSELEIGKELAQINFGDSSTIFFRICRFQPEETFGLNGCNPTSLTWALSTMHNFEQAQWVDRETKKEQLFLGNRKQATIFFLASHHAVL